MKWMVMVFFVCWTFAVSNQQISDGSCVKDGVVYEDGYQHKPDPCTTCFCRSGSYNCMMVMCAWPRCQNNVHPIVRQGDCCPSCP